MHHPTFCVEIIETFEKSGQEFAEFLRVETSTGEFLHTCINGFTEDVINDAKMLAMAIPDLEGVAHKSDVVVAWMIRVGRKKLLCNFAPAVQEVLAQGVDVDFDGDIFVVASTLLTVCRLVGHLEFRCRTHTHADPGRARLLQSCQSPASHITYTGHSRLHLSEPDRNYPRCIWAEFPLRFACGRRWCLVEDAANFLCRVPGRSEIVGSCGYVPV